MKALVLEPAITLPHSHARISPSYLTINITRLRRKRKWIQEDYGLQEGAAQDQDEHRYREEGIDLAARMAGGDQVGDVVLLVLDSIARWHLDHHDLVREEADVEGAVRGIQAALGLAQVGVLVRRLVYVKDGVDLVPDVIVVAVEDVVVVRIVGHIVHGHGAAVAEGVHDVRVGALVARSEEFLQQDHSAEAVH